MQNLDRNVKIVNEDGTPTEFFMRILQERGIGQDANTTDIQMLEQRRINTSAPLAGGGDLTADRTLSMQESGVTPNSYGDATHVPQFTVDSFGRITLAADVPIVAPSVLEVDDSSGTIQTEVVKLKFTGGVTVTAPAAGEALVDISGGGGVPSTRTIATTGGLQGGGDLTADRTLSLVDTGVSPGTYSFATVTVDAKGRITGISAGTAPTPSYIYAPVASGSITAPTIIFTGVGEVVMARIV